VLLASAALVVPNASAMMNAIASPSLLLMSLGFSFKVQAIFDHVDDFILK
jgi:hypothetical protein